jgi:hypothetical protein
VSTLLPAALLLLWSGAAATLVASLVLAPLLGESAGALAVAPRPSQPQAMLFGLLVLPLLYGVVLSLIHEANLVTGAILGSVHAAVLALRSVRYGGRDLLRENTNRCLLCIAYGALLGFTYVTP